MVSEMADGRELLGETALTPPGPETVGHVMQHMESRSERIYQEGFEKLSAWIVNIPEWFVRQGVHDGRPLVVILVEFLKDKETGQGDRAGVACHAIATLAQTITGRDGFRSVSAELIPLLLDIVTSQEDVVPEAKMNAVLCLGNLSADALIKEQVRRAGAIPVLVAMLDVKGQDDFEGARKALGALMNICNSRVGLDDLRAAGAKKLLDKLDLAVQAVDPQTAYLKSISARIHFIQTNIALNEKDASKLALVDPALVAKSIGEVTGRVKTNDKRNRKKKMEVSPLRGKEVAAGVKKELEVMKQKAGEEIRRSKLNESAWGSAYKKYFNNFG